MCSAGLSGGVGEGGSVLCWEEGKRGRRTEGGKRGGLVISAGQVEPVEGKFNSLDF